MVDFDSPWKEALDRYFEAFLAFFFPHAHADIDWTKGYKSLDKELQQIARRGELGKRVVDKLVQVWLKNGREEWLLVHVEVQSQEETDFARRMFIYNYRVFDRYNRTVVSLAVLADDQPEWRPHEFHYGLWGCRVSVEFPIAKLLDYAANWQALESSPNPFALLTLAHVKAQQTRHDPAERRLWKTRLVRGLFDRGLGAEDIRQLFRFLDWLLSLPKELDEAFWQEVHEFEEEKNMPFITSVERIGMEKGLKEGLREGHKKGLREGRIQGLHEAIAVALDLKFGAEGRVVRSEAAKVKDAKSLRLLLQKIQSSSKISEVQRWLAKSEK